MRHVEWTWRLCHFLYPQCGIRLGRFRGRDRLGDFIDNRHYWGNAFALLRRAEAFLLDHVHIAGRVLPGKMRREDRPQYPPPATREALANALCHRDYSNAGASVSLAMYDDHLEIVNPGKFHHGLNPENLAQPHESKLWNPIIAGVFYRAGIIEKWGTGTLKIIDWCREGHCPYPLWKEQSGNIYITFYPAAEFGEEEVSIFKPSVSESELSPETMSRPKLDPKPGSIEYKILEKLLRRPLSKGELSKELGHKQISGAFKRGLQNLRKRGFIDLTIPTKPTSRLQKYRLNQKGKAWLDES